MSALDGSRRHAVHLPRLSRAVVRSHGSSRIVLERIRRQWEAWLNIGRRPPPSSDRYGGARLSKRNLLRFLISESL